jgi:hypothetical protein
LPQIKDRIVLVPLISWAAPASRGECLFLAPSIRYCTKALNFTPDSLEGRKAIKSPMARLIWRIMEALPKKQSASAPAPLSESQRLQKLWLQRNDK